METIGRWLRMRQRKHSTTMAQSSSNGSAPCGGPTKKARLFLMGTGEVGKTTIIKQLQVRIDH